MDIKDITNNHNLIKRLILNKEIHKSIDLMKSICQIENIPIIGDALCRIEETYRYMIHYMIKGYKDNHRQKVYGEIIDDLFTFNDKINYELRKRVDNSKYFSELRMIKSDNRNISFLVDEYKKMVNQISIMLEASQYDYALMQSKEKILNEIFLKVWLTQHLSNSDTTIISDTLSDNFVNPTLKSQIISALFLGLSEYYDSHKLILLLDDYQKHRRMQSLVALIIILSQYHKRVSLCNNIKDRISILSIQDHFIDDLRAVILNLIKTRDTDRINKKMKDEVIPEIMKLRPNISNKLRDLATDSDVLSMEENPEWQEMLEKSGISDKLKEIGDMQMEGGDVMMIAFSNLKKFPFFNTISNWFLPFDINHSELSSLRSFNNDNLMNLMCNDSVMCDSDKYSFALSIANMPEMHRNMMLSQFDAQFSQLAEERRSSLKQSLIADSVAETTKCVRDLYRFFKLNNNRKDFRDPFNGVINISDIPYISDLIKSTDIPMLVAEFYFTRGYYSEAFSLFKEYVDTDSPNFANELQKMGFCLQNQKKYSEALIYYKKAELFASSGIWLMKKIAVCHKYMHEYEIAAKYYLKLLSFNPEDVNILMNVGHCLLEDGKPQDALKYYYNAEYLDENGTRALRPIAWCELVLKRHEKSRQYFAKILMDNPSYTDYMNFGHLCLTENKIDEAVNLYKKSIVLCNNDVEKFISVFNDDIPVLIELGVNSEDLILVREALTYDNII